MRSIPLYSAGMEDIRKWKIAPSGHDRPNRLEKPWSIIRVDVGKWEEALSSRPSLGSSATFHWLEAPPLHCVTSKLMSGAELMSGVELMSGAELTSGARHAWRRSNALDD